ncbi:dentin sialophosphoprotein [Aplysia californica]|uniref:Dentin sialophosphoprotein n=1 Tax=Aplysia californica TaxID=6500 RepID=A0ABM0JFP2_APLCA|nr:dentin sialophosphoprotein [Aplysia californica]XP_005092604.1 dentin sialophosphoprotein [Aplysia californica]XP_005092605.1 dentin sialophosphoprotein [Aplysia californica]XP_005092606.1 dentin sialophosphoprotein [Aplysia californica]
MMDRQPGQNAEPPESLNSLEFPPLPSRSDTVHLVPQTVAASQGSMSQKNQGVKRTICDDGSDSMKEESFLSSSNNSGSHGSSSPPSRKSRRMAYRDVNLPSLDSDTLHSMFSSPTFGDSQNSLSSTAFRSSMAVSPNDSLGSLGDIISRYNNATLDSMKGFEISFSCDSDNANTSPVLLSPTSKGNSSSDFSVSSMPSISKSLSKPLAQEDSSDSGNVLFESKRSFEYYENVQITSAASVESDFTSSGELQCKAVTLSAGSSCKSSLDVKIPESRETKSKKADDLHQQQYLSHGSKKDRKVAGCLQKGKGSGKFTVDSTRVKDTSDDDYDCEDAGDFCDAIHMSECNTDILQNLKKCKKNPKHEKFFLTSDLKVRDLPREIQHEDSLTFLNCMSQLVVQITVHSTSSGRDSDDVYRSYIGTDRKRHGSGFIASVDESIQRFRCRKEDCLECCLNMSSDSNTPYSPPITDIAPSFDRSVSTISTASSSSASSSGGSSQKHYFYGGLNIRTNRHVIFDKSEADNAYVKFFFNTPDGKGVVHGHVGSIIGVNTCQDHIILHVMSHKKSLFHYAETCLKNARSSYNQMVCSTIKTQETLAPKLLQSWVAVISHPHGLAKHISIGHVCQEKVEARRVIKYYNAATCPGSSGGLVITPTLLKLQWPGAVHSLYDKHTRFNVTLDSRFPDLDNTDMGRLHKTIVCRKDSFPDNYFNL